MIPSIAHTSSVSWPSTSVSTNARAVSGLPAWLLWRAYYLSQMPTLGRKVRIFVEWTWGMFFPADITHLRFSRSREQR